MLLFLSGSGGVAGGCCGSYYYISRGSYVQSSVDKGLKVDNPSLSALEEGREAPAGNLDEIRSSLTQDIDNQSSEDESASDETVEMLTREPKIPVVKWWQVRIQEPEEDDDGGFEEEMSEVIEGKLFLVKEADSDWVGQHIYKLIPSFNRETAQPEGTQFELPFASPKNEREINKLTEDINGETIVTPDSISDVLSTFRGNQRKLIGTFGASFFEQLIQEVQKLQSSN
ncbi:hypothetical protein MHLP_01990 [Candidatus Mycoplasma haematolamae str. Purdue]|uniref:Uncharacterized protein n=1 Tax=Mycoplasma haematolamae (strain Purdue) TaxID=1212765 RepID=I7BJF8_MYCHA|nr:hypothetical protein [Candidatus Mycoplasma haematolamae]AFO51978.1 hypothetical protein MHLP_01990 [Candidatus Mycoplasma haematolamae str. Purdue]